MPISRATARSVTASCVPVRSISAMAADTMSSVSLAPWPRAFRCRRPGLIPALARVLLLALPAAGSKFSML